MAKTYKTRNAPMTKFQRRVKSLLAERGLRIVDLPELTGFAISTIYRALRQDVLTSRRLKRSRQAITNVLRSEIFPEILPTNRSLIIPIGTEIEAPDDDRGADLKVEFGDYITQKSGRTFVFVRPAHMTFIN